MFLYNINQSLIVALVIAFIFLCFYKKIDWFIFFLALEILHLYISVNLLYEVVVYNSHSILVAILYILCLGVLKSVLGVLLMVIDQNKNNTSTR